MKMTLSTDHAAGLLVEDDNAAWTYAGARALIEYLEELEEGTDEEIEFDRVAIRCDYSQHSSLREWAEDYFTKDWESEIGVDPEDDDDETNDKIREHINDNGQLIEFDGGVIVSSF